MECYLDNCATTKVYDEVAEEIKKVMLEDYGNPSSLHKKGRDADDRVNEARNSLGLVINASPEEIYFNSCASEGNNQVLRNFKGHHIITTEIEHPSVRNTLKELQAEGTEVTFLKCDKMGKVDLEDFKNALRKDTMLVSIMHVNNEVGSINDLEAMGEIIKKGGFRAKFHADCVQSFLKFPIDVKSMGLDYLTASAHKAHGPKGIGLLYIRKGLKLNSLISGGGQEKGTRAGTHNVPYIAGFGLASRMILPNMEENRKTVLKFKEYLYNALGTYEGFRLNGSLEGFSPYILNVSFKGLRSEVLLRLLEEKGVYVSTGSACSSKNMKDSHVLTAMGLTKDEIKGSIRICFSDTTTQEEIEKAAEGFDYALKFAGRLR